MRRPLLYDLIRIVTRPYWRRHRLRTSLTVAGVAIGVATVIGMANASATVLASFGHMIETMAGDAQLEITSPSGHLEESIAARAAEVPGVRTAAGIVEASLPIADWPGESLYLLGVDFLGSPVWETQFPRAAFTIDDELGFVAQPDSVVLTGTLLERMQLNPGDGLGVLISNGRRELRIRGVLGAVAAAGLFDGALGVMDLPAAQQLLGREGQVDRVAVKLESVAELEAVRQRLTAALGPAVEVAAPESRGRQAESLLLSLRTMLATLSSTSVMVGALIVFHTVAVSVRQRRREFALVNVAGFPSRALVHLCLFETLVLALVGAAIGVGGGVLLGQIASSMVASAVSDVWLRVDASRPAFSTVGLAIGLASGVGSALFAAAIAIRSTFASTTVEALRPIGFEANVRGTSPRVIACGLLLIASSSCVALAPPGVSFAVIVTLMVGCASVVYLGAALLAPGWVLTVGYVGNTFARRASWLPVRLAAANLPRDPLRGGATVATIVVATSIALNAAGTVASFTRGWKDWTEQHFAADLMVGAGGRVRILGGEAMPAAVADELRATPGVAAVEPFRTRRIQLEGREVFLQGVALQERLRHGGLPMVDGDLSQAAPALEAGTGVLLSDNLAYRLQRHLGDTVEISTLAGLRIFRIEGTFTDYLGSLDLGAVAVAHSQLEVLWGDSSANLFRVWLAPGALATDVRMALLSRLAAGRGYYVLTARQFLEAVDALVQGFFNATWALQIIAALIGIIGIVNAQLAAVLDRSGEIGMLRTIGVSQRDITRSVLVECGALGLAGALGGLVVGTLLTYELVAYSLRLITGWQLPFHLPPGLMLASVAAAVLVSALAGFVPARAAAMVVGQNATGVD